MKQLGWILIVVSAGLLLFNSWSRGVPFAEASVHYSEVFAAIETLSGDEANRYTQEAIIRMYQARPRIILPTITMLIGFGLVLRFDRKKNTPQQGDASDSSPATGSEPDDR